MAYVVREVDASPNAPIGGKARALAALRDTGLPIPPWFVLVPEAFRASLTDAERTALENADVGARVRAAVEQVQPSAAICDELAKAVAELCPDGESVAVRSSASDEDGTQHSFAGQLDSFVFVPQELVAAKVALVWRSTFSDRIVAYRQEHGLGLVPRAPAVLIQRMVHAEMAGVAFGADPVSGRHGLAVVSAVYGLGTALVSGESDADTYYINRDRQIVQRSIAVKHHAHRPAPGSAEGVQVEPVPGERGCEPALTDPQVLAVADLVRRSGAIFGRPQDIEWAIANDELFVLQSRPITSLARSADPDGVLNLWDNSNIAESYSGITTPLTFSFARRIYEEVYRQFCLILRVPKATLDRNRDIFPRMLGLVRGRVYYNLINWYRLLALLPGFQMNRSFMEQMMGVKEGLPQSIAASLSGATWSEKLRDGLHFVGSLAALIRQHLGLPRSIQRFYVRLEQALGKSRPDLEPLLPDELAAYYRDLERQLLERWDAPLVNDFFAMIFYGLLRKLVENWCGDVSGSLQNDLLCGDGGMISAEPALRVRKMAEAARGNAALIEALCTGGRIEIERAMAPLPAFRAQFEDYLDRFGDRCAEELKLESSTLHDDALPLLRSVGLLAQRTFSPAASSGAPPSAPVGDELDKRRAAEQRVRAVLRSRPLRRIIFAWVLRDARARVRDRENLRFERTRLFGRVRSIVVELGRKFHSVDLLDHPRDIFYLEIGEALGFIDGITSTTDLKRLVALRKAEFDRFRQMEPPADRFETRGVVHQGNTFAGTAETVAPDGEQRSGLGCCPGVVRGPVRVVVNPAEASLAQGDILVAARTDPGWIMIFPSAAGLVVEHGSLLSHSAIVAREMGIPAVVSVGGVTRWLKTGDWVELDGSRGVVTRLQAAERAGVDGH
jgi:pyruvate,water dikinase